MTLSDNFRIEVRLGDVFSRSLVCVVWGSDWERLKAE